MAATVAWISIAPVKGMRLEQLSQVELTRQGAVGDREFFLVDGKGSMISVTRLGPLVEIVADHDRDRGSLALRFPGDRVVSGPVETGPPEPVRFYGLAVEARPVRGDFSGAISDHCGTGLRLMERPDNRPAVDRGSIAGVTLLGAGSLGRLESAAGEAGEAGPIDPRRFRMNFGVDGIGPHEEDDWIDRSVALGEAEIRVHDRVGRCAATTRDPDRGEVDLKTLHHIRSYRDDVVSDEPLPFGVYASVARPGLVRLGDPVVPVDRDHRL
ncbi:MAG: MOSC domain-containing protein [Solirubrobacterales bacterium]|nr:MOSC domain-containing protein [Solirubrobacterales bacterium]